MSRPDPSNPEQITPVVLVGGGSTRFGRNKLLEPLGNGLLVDRPIAALRLVFACPIGVVGACDGAVAARGDRVVPDPYPGVGPLGGVLAALEHTGSSVFVLPGDVPRIDAAAIRAVVEASQTEPHAWVVCARTEADDRVHPTIALYRPAAIGALRGALQAERYGLGRAIPAEHRAGVSIHDHCAHNINHTSDVDGL